MSNIGFIVCARVKSSRLDEKVLQMINGRRTIEVLLDHLNNPQYPIVLAIPTAKEDDILQEIAEERGIQVYRGQNDSPLHRLADCAAHFGFDDVVRITADDILIDTYILFDQIKFHVRGGWEYTYCKRLPEGVGAEVIKTSVLEEIASEIDKPVEFISYYIKERFKTKEYFPRPEYQQPFRLTMDYEEDLMLLRVLFASLPEGFGTLDFINFLKRHKYFTAINKLPAVTVYTCNYNTSKYIVDAMQSVLNQTFEDFEYIIVDDCSDDDSMNVITEFYSKQSRQNQKKMKVLRNEKNIGLSACCNSVLGMARGRYVIRLDSDDIMDISLLEQQIFQVKVDESDACISAYHTADEGLNPLESVKRNMWHPGCALVSTWHANELKYREDVEFMEGKDFWDRFRQLYKVSFLNMDLWTYRQRPGQKTQDDRHPNNV